MTSRHDIQPTTPIASYQLVARNAGAAFGLGHSDRPEPLMGFPLVSLHVSEHVLPRLAREIIDANLTPNVPSRENAEVPLHESPELVLVRLRGNKAAHSLYVLKLLAIPALDRHRRRRARVIADRREADDQVEEPANGRVLAHRTAVPRYLDHRPVLALRAEEAVARHRGRALRRLGRDALVAL